MFDELFDLFDRGDEPDSRRPHTDGTPRRGVRGFFSRLLNGSEEGAHDGGDDRGDRRAGVAPADRRSNRRDGNSERERDEGFGD